MREHKGMGMCEYRGCEALQVGTFPFDRRMVGRVVGAPHRIELPRTAAAPLEVTHVIADVALCAKHRDLLFTPASPSD